MTTTPTTIVYMAAMMQHRQYVPSRFLSQQKEKESVVNVVTIPIRTPAPTPTLPLPKHPFLSLPFLFSCFFLFLVLNFFLSFFFIGLFSITHWETILYPNCFICDFQTPSILSPTPPQQPNFLVFLFPSPLLLFFLLFLRRTKNMHTNDVGSPYCGLPPHQSLFQSTQYIIQSYYIMNMLQWFWMDLICWILLYLTRFLCVFGSCCWYA